MNPTFGRTSIDKNLTNMGANSYKNEIQRKAIVRWYVKTMYFFLKKQNNNNILSACCKINHSETQKSISKQMKNELLHLEVETHIKSKKKPSRFYSVT